MAQPAVESLECMLGLVCYNVSMLSNEPLETKIGD
jgi:hypothetical protein